MNDQKVISELKNQENSKFDNLVVKIERKNLGMASNLNDDSQRTKNKNFNKYISHLSP